MSNLDGLKQQYELLIKEIDSLLGLADNNIQEEKRIKEAELNLRKFESELKDKERLLNNKEEEIKGQIDYLRTKNLDFISKEKQIETKLRKVTEAEATIREAELKEKDIDEKMKQLEGKLQVYKELEKEKEQIAHLRSMLNKETLIDRERKDKLDTQAQENEREKKRLQILADSIRKSD